MYSSMWRTRRQIVTILAFIIGILLFIILPYWATHRVVPSCFDNKKNQGEQGVDCGGPCTLQCQGSPVVKNINIVWVNIFPVRPGAYDLVAQVENPNIAIGAPRIPYIAKLFDANGQVIAQRDGETFAGSNEHFTIFAGNILTGEKVATRGSIEITPGFSWVTTTAPKKMLSVSGKTLVGVDDRPKLSATLASGEPEVLRNIEVTVVIYDSKGKPIAASATNVEKLDPNGSEKLFFTWPAPLSYVAETGQCETPVDIVLALDRSGSMASESKNPPQPFTRVKDATASFVDFLTSADQVGMVSFATHASSPIDVPLTPNFIRAKQQIEAVSMGTDGVQYTNTGEALLRAKEELETLRARSEARKVLVLLTDGEAMEPNRPEQKGDLEYPKRYAIDIADQLKKSNVAIFTIGLGVNANDAFLKKISTSPDDYFVSPSVSDLRNVYQQVSTAICKKGPSVIEIIPRVNMMMLPIAQ